MFYFEIDKDSEYYGKAYEIFHYRDDWLKDEVQNDLKDALGFDVDKNLCLNSRNLMVKNAPEHLKEQFKMRRIDGLLVAKKKSKLNKRFLEIVEKYNLKERHLIELSRMHLDIKGKHTLHPLNDDRFVFEVDSSLDAKKLKENDGLTELKESDFFKLKEEKAKEDERKMQNGTKN